MLTGQSAARIRRYRPTVARSEETWPTLELSSTEVLTTTRAVRKRLDLDRPVPRGLVEECLDIAAQAPNASNQQRVVWVVVDDPATRAGMADVYRAGAEIRAAQGSGAAASTAEMVAASSRMSASAAHLRERMHDVPILVVPTIYGRLDGADVATQAARWGSILPAVWSFMLALRARGLGSAWTTVHLFEERAMADLLGIPYDEVTQAGLFPVAWTIGTEFRRGMRDAGEGAVRWNGW